MAKLIAPVVLVTAVSLCVGWKWKAVAESDDGDSTTRHQETERNRVTIYHQDADHLWNQVHAALLTRVGPDGKVYGQDRLEPLLWTDSEHLLQGTSAKRAMAVLAEFQQSNGERLIVDPVKRAVLQRDFWLVFNWLAGQEQSEARDRLAELLAETIHRVALTPEQIASLPENYTQAVNSKTFATRFDAQKPQQSYLPPDLLRDHSSWVSVGRIDGPTAPFHLRENGTNAFTNSVFLLFLKLPEGRTATETFLQQLAKFEEPLLLPDETSRNQRRPDYVPNPQIPPWPKGTQAALVRRALLIDTEGNVVSSPLTESVQLRITLADAPELTREVLNEIGTRRSFGWHEFYEFQLRRGELFANVSGGLVDVTELRDFKTGFNAHGWDEFDRKPNSRPFPERSQPFKNSRSSCVACHNFPGVYSFNSLQGFAFGSMRPMNGQREPHVLKALEPNVVSRAAAKWKQDQSRFKMLKQLLEE